MGYAVAERSATAERTITLEITREHYARVTNSARLFGFLPGTKRKLAEATDEYETAWQSYMTEPPADDTDDVLQQEIATREAAQAADWARRRYARQLERYHKLPRWQKLGIGAVAGAAGGSATLIAAVSGATVLAAGTLLGVRLSRGAYNYSRRSARHLFEKPVRSGPAESVGRLALHSILDTSVEQDLEASRRTAALTLGGIALGALGRVVAITETVGELRGGLAVPAQAVAEVRPEKTVSWEPLMDTESPTVALFCRVNDIDMNSLSPRQIQQIEAGNGKAVLQQLNANTVDTPTKKTPKPKSKIWQLAESRPRGLRVLANGKGDYQIRATERYNSIWAQATEAWKMQGVQNPSLAQIDDVKDQVIAERKRRGLSSLLRNGEKVRFRRRFFRLA